MVEKTCQRKIKGPQGRQPIQKESGGGAGGKKGPEKEAERHA